MRSQLLAMFPKVRRRFPFSAGGVAAAAVALAAVFVAAFLLTLPGRPLETVRRQTFITPVGQTATIALSDGTIVTLDTQSELEAIERSSRREVFLTRGRAYFRVAKDPSRPFIVHANERSVRALGTAFTVWNEGPVVQRPSRYPRPGPVITPSNNPTKPNSGQRYRWRPRPTPDSAPSSG